MRAPRADITYITSRLVRIAVVVGFCAAAAHLIFAPPPPPDDLSLQRSLRGRSEWLEWRDDDFYARVAALDRSDPAVVVAEYLDAFRRGSVRGALLYTSDNFQRSVTPRTLSDTIRTREDRNEVIVEFSVSDALIDGDVAFVRAFERLSNGSSRIRRMRVVNDPDPYGWGFDSARAHRANGRAAPTRDVAPPVVRNHTLPPPASPEDVAHRFLEALRSNHVANVYVLCSERLQSEYTPEDLNSALTLYAPSAVRDANAEFRIADARGVALVHVDFQMFSGLITLTIALAHDAAANAWWIDEVLPNDAYYAVPLHGDDPHDAQ